MQVKPMMKQTVQETLDSIAAFSVLLEKETAALKKSDFKTVDALQADKRVLAKRYEEKVTALFARRTDLPKLDAALRDKMTQERARFNKLLSENMQALDLAQGCTKRLINHILDAARQSVAEDNKTHYASNGKTSAARSASTSLALDREL